MRHKLDQLIAIVTDIGVYPNHSKGLNKTTKLINVIGVAVLLVCLLQLFFIPEKFNTLTYFRIGLNLALPFLVIYFNKKGHYLFSKYFFALVYAIIILLRSSKFENNTGEIFYYFPMVIFAFLAFENESKIKLIIGLLIPIIGILSVELLDWSQFSELQYYSNNFILGAKFINLLLSLSGTSIIVFYYINLNKIQERQNQEEQVYQLNNQKSNLESANNLLLDQIRSQNLELINSQFLLKQAKDYGKLGAWNLDLYSSKISWDDQVFRSFELDPTLNKVPEMEEYFSLIHHEDRPTLQESVKSAISTLREFTCEVRQFQTKSRTYRWFLAKGKVVLNDELQPIALSGINIDINELILAKQNLRESEEALEQLLRSASAGICLIHKGDIIYANQSMAEMIGYSMEEFKTLKLEEVIKPDFYSSFDDLIKKIQVLNSSIHHDVIVYKRDGGSIDVSITCDVMVFKGKTVICATAIDISARKSYEKQLLKNEQDAKDIQNSLKQQNELFEHLYDNIPVMLILVDQNGEILKINKHFTTITGYGRLEFTNTSILFLESSQLGIFWTELPITTKQGHSKITNWILIRLSNGINLYMGEDITKERLAQQQIHDNLNQLKELNNTLAKNEESLKKSNVALYEKNILLNESEFKAKLISESTFEAVLLLNNGQIVEANAMASELFNFKLEDLSSIQLLNFVVPSQRASFNEILLQENNEPTEIIFLTKEGNLFFGEIRGRSFQYQLQELKILTIRDVTERVQKEKLQKESQTYIANIFEALPLGLFLVENSDSTFYNTKLLELLELGPDFKGKITFFDFVHPDDAHSFKTLIDNEKDAITNQIDIKIITSKGNEKYVSLSKSFIPHQHQKIHIITCQDISERKKIEHNLKRSYSYQYSILNTGKIGYWATDLQHKLLFCNDYHQIMMKSIFGKVMEIGNSVLDYLPDSSFEEEYKKYFNSLILSGEPATITREIKGISNNIYSIEYTMNPIFEEGIISGILVRAKDITAYVLASKSVYESEKRLRQSQKIAKIGYWEFDIVAKTIVWSDEMFKIHDLEPDYKPTFESNYELLGKENQKYLERIIREAILNGTKWKHECFIYTSKGANKWVRIIGIPVFDENGSLTKLTGTTQDITDNKITELKVKENEELLETIIENLPVAFQMYDSNGYSLRMNEVQRRFLGIDPFNQNEIYNIFQDELHYDHNFLGALTSVFKGDKLQFNGLKMNTLDHNEEVQQKYFDLVFLPVFDQMKKLKTVIYLGIDVSESVYKEQQLELKHQELIETTKKIAEYRMMALRSVMNPHFLFNSLNAIQYFIAKNERELALTYLSLFSKLVRKILESSIATKISLTDELSILRYYVELENLRFDNKFVTIFDIASSINTDEIEVPSLVLQPYVENSVIHGLLNKDKGQGVLKIKIMQKDDLLLCTVEDNGIGRKAASTLKLGIDHKSLGMTVTEERLNIINKIDDVSVNIIDLYDEYGNPTGTRNDIVIRILN